MKCAFAFMLLLACVVRADFDEGNRAYDRGDFLEARKHYEAQVTRGEWTANLFYNLGNANERLGAAGLAMLGYERVLALQPGHVEARANLKFLREQSLAKMPARTWRDAVFGNLNFAGWLMTATLAAWIAVFTLLVPWVWRRQLGAAGVFWFVLLVCVAGLAACGAWLASGELDAGVVIVKQVEARQGPADRAALVDVLPAGSRVRVLSVRGEWTYCELPGGTRAWLSSSAVERVRLSS